MDLEELKTEHPRIFAACIAEGVEHERDRVMAHLEAGRNCGAMELAEHAILKGDDMTLEIMQHYLQAARRGAELAAWSQDCDVVESVLMGAKRPKSSFEDPLETRTLAELRRLLGQEA